jgi:hypothetical protein
MATKKTVKKTTTTLAKAKDVKPLDLTSRFNAVNAALVQLADAPVQLAPAERAELLSNISKWGRLLDATAKVHKDEVKKMVLEQGEVVTEAGTKRMESGGYVWEVRPQKSGYDAKKVEAGLRAQGLNPQEHMQMEVSYSVDQAKLDALVADGKLSMDELKDWEVEKTYNVQAPKPVKEET